MVATLETGLMPLIVTMPSWLAMALSILFTSYSLLVSSGDVREVAGNFTSNFRPPSVPLVVVDPYLRSVYVSRHAFLSNYPSVIFIYLANIKHHGILLHVYCQKYDT